jgi:hypothetical protein
MGDVYWQLQSVGCAFPIYNYLCDFNVPEKDNSPFWYNKGYHGSGGKKQWKHRNVFIHEKKIRRIKNKMAKRARKISRHSK